MDANARFRLKDRLLAEAVRLHEVRLQQPLELPGEALPELEALPTFEERIVARARWVGISDRLREALDDLRWASIWVLVVAVAVAAVAGAAAAGVLVAAGPGEPANIFRVLTILLGFHALALLVWLVAIITAPHSAAAGLFGRLTLQAGRWLAARLARASLHRGDDGEGRDQVEEDAPARPRTALEAGGATAVVLGSTRLGRWLASTVSHGLWLAFFVGCLVSALLLLGTRHVTFAWETTILDRDDYVVITDVLATVPGALGFPVPDAADVRASQWLGNGPVASQSRGVWAGFLIGCLAVYGAGARLVLLALSVIQARRAASAYRLDTTRPGIARLYPVLMAPSRSVGITQDEADLADVPVPPAPPVRGPGPVALVGLEIGLPNAGWPPDANGITWLDLGIADDRSGQRAAIDRLRTARPRARLAVVVASLVETPDRGVGTFLAEVQNATDTALFIALSEAGRLTQRSSGAGLEQRSRDWRQCAARAGIPESRVRLIDLHGDMAAGAELAAWVRAAS